ncbi:MAG: hypothetical protein JXB17_00420 [Bacteroidales bacterium]|nr:hypothetical protein [Bacteroidales bacterium]
METELKSLYVILFLCFLSYLNTYAQDQIQTIRCWQIDKYGYKDSIACDTAWNSFQIMNPIYKNNISCSYLGGLGSPYLNNDFNSRVTDEHLFLSPYKKYIHQSLNTIFYNSKKPFSNVTYTSSTGSKEKLEQSLRLIHNQNINPKFNGGFQYYIISDNGQYQADWNDKLKRSRINSLSFYSNFNGDNYSAHGDIDFNIIGPLEETGGIVFDTVITDTSLRSQNIDVRLKSAETRIKNQNFFFLHEYKFGNYKNYIDSIDISNDPIFSLVHSIHFNRSIRNYYDRGKSSDPYDYYPNNYYIDSLNTNDSAYIRSISNSFYFKILENPFSKFTLTGTAGVTFNLEKFGYSVPIDTIVNFRPDNIVNIDDNLIVFHNNDTSFNFFYDTTFFETAVNGNFYTIVRNKFYLNIQSNYYLSGYNKNDFNIKFIVSKSIKILNQKNWLIIEAYNKKETPNYLISNYCSNYLKWDNNFKPLINKYLKFEFVNDTSNYNISFTINNINNYTYLNAKVIPDQLENSIYVYSANLGFRFNLWKFYFNNKLLFQETNAADSVLSLPKFSVYNSTYFQFNIVKNVLKAQIGFDFYYNTKFYMPAYNPAFGQFHTQNEKILGNYPYFDIFINAKWKRVRIFGLLEHANTIIQLHNRNYFSALHYPRNAWWIKLGISWNFYD